MNLTPEQEELSRLIHGEPTAPKPQGVIYVGGGAVAFGAAQVAKYCRDMQVAFQHVDQITDRLRISAATAENAFKSLRRGAAIRIQYPDDERLPLGRRLFLAMKRGFELSKIGGNHA